MSLDSNLIFHSILARVYIQQVQGSIPLMVFDFQVYV